MGCEILKLKDGVAIVCSRGRQRQKTCDVAGCTRVASYLCDHPLKGALAGTTCDRALCHVHARQIAPDRHLCPAHARLEVPR